MRIASVGRCEFVERLPEIGVAILCYGSGRLSCADGKQSARARAIAPWSSIQHQKILMIMAESPMSMSSDLQNCMVTKIFRYFS